MKRSILFAAMMAASAMTMACEDRSQHDPSAFQPGGECYTGGGNAPQPAVEPSAIASASVGNVHASGGSGGVAFGGDPTASSSLSFVGGSPSSSSSSSASAGASSHSTSGVKNSGNSTLTQTYVDEADPIDFRIPHPRSLRGYAAAQYAPRRFNIDGSGNLVARGAGIAVTAYNREQDAVVQRLVAETGASIVCDVQNHGMRGRWHNNRNERYTVTDQIRDSYKSLSRSTKNATKSIIVVVDPAHYTRGAGSNAGAGQHDNGFTGIVSGVASYAFSDLVWETEVYCLDKPMSVNFYPAK